MSHNPVFSIACQTTQFSPSVCHTAKFSPNACHKAQFSPNVCHTAQFSVNVCHTPQFMSPGVISPVVMSPAVISPMVRNPVVINPVVIRPAVVSLAVSSPAVISLTVLSPAVMKTGSSAAYRRPICITQISLNINIGWLIRIIVLSFMLNQVIVEHIMANATCYILDVGKLSKNSENPSTTGSNDDQICYNEITIQKSP